MLFTEAQLCQIKFNNEVWLSLVERYVRDVEVASSNLVTSTISSVHNGFRYEHFFLYKMPKICYTNNRGGDKLNKLKNTIGKVLAYIVAIPIVILLLIGLVLYLLFVPFDILRYHRMPYYKGTKKKYKFFITSKDIVILYNKIKQKDLPIEYFCNIECEYFIKDNVVLLPGRCYDSFEEKDGEWYFLFDYDSGFGESDTTAPILMKDVLSEELVSIKEEHKGLPAKFLVFYNDITDAQKFESFKKCPFFYAANSVEDI